MKTDPFTLLTPVYPHWRLFNPTGTRLSLLTLVYPHWHSFAPADVCSPPTDAFYPRPRSADVCLSLLTLFNPYWHSFATTKLDYQIWLNYKTNHCRKTTRIFFGIQPTCLPGVTCKVHSFASPNACIFHQHEYTNIIHAPQRSRQSGIIT